MKRKPTDDIVYLPKCGNNYVVSTHRDKLCLTAFLSRQLLDAYMTHIGIPDGYTITERDVSDAALLLSCNSQLVKAGIRHIRLVRSDDWQSTVISADHARNMRVDTDMQLMKTGGTR